MTSATTAVSPEFSEPTCERTPSPSPESNTALSESSTSNALKPGLSVIDNGLSREAWRAGHDSGEKRGAISYFQSRVMEQLSLELTIQRIAIQAMSGAAEQRERLLAHWKSEAGWWKTEHDKVHAAYCEFVKSVAKAVKK
jgi:hypothetical protein